jgi:hypothetical protein
LISIPIANGHFVNLEIEAGYLLRTSHFTIGDIAESKLYSVPNLC